MAARVRHQRCMVLNCPGVAAHTWCSQAINRQSIVKWYVCVDHCAQLFAGHGWALDYERAPYWQRWILMGDDLPSAVSPTRRRTREEVGEHHAAPS
jgi:hypothetical protein